MYLYNILKFSLSNIFDLKQIGFIIIHFVIKKYSLYYCSTNYCKCYITFVNKYLYLKMVIGKLIMKTMQNLTKMLKKDGLMGM